jgi:hypothetical protein
MPLLSSLGTRAAQVTLGIALVAMIGVVLAGSPHPRLTPDSASYLTGAEKLAHEGTFADCAGPIVLFAPGFSAAMAPLVALGVDATDAARVVNAIATLVLVLAAALLARAAGLSRNACLVAAIAVAVSYATLRDGPLAWSEPLFCAILGVLLVVVVDDGRGVAAQLSARAGMAVVLAWMLLLTRHSGLFVVPAVVAAAWLGSSELLRRSARTAAFALALVAVPALWWARNLHVGGSVFGQRSGSRFGALEVLWQLPKGVSSLALPSALPLALRLVVLGAILVAAVLAFPASRENTRARLTVWVLSIAVVVYGLAVTGAAMRTVVDPIDTRLMSPLLVPGAVLVAVGVSAGHADWPRLQSALRVVVLALVAAMVVLAPGVVWRGHTAERSLANIPDDVSCADWPARYSGRASVGLARDPG